MGNTLPRVNFNLQSADTEVGVSAQKVLIIGQKLSTGTATANTLIKDIGNDNSWETLFGSKSVLAGMIRQARKLCSYLQYQVAIDVIALEDAEDSVASTGSIAFSGTATATGEIEIVVGSEYNHKYALGVVEANTASQLATKLAGLINADAKAPFVATTNSGIVTLTYSNKGSIGNNTTIYYKGSVSGVTLTLTAFSGGVTDPAVDETLLGLITSLRYNEVVSPIEYGIDKIITLLDGRFNTNNKILDGALYVTKTDTLANHKLALKALNSQNVNYQCDKLVAKADYVGSSIPEFSYIKAIYNAFLKALRVSDGSQLSTVVIGQYPQDQMGGVYNNSLPFFNTSCPFLNPIMPENHWSSDSSNNEIKEINDVGGSVWDNNAEDNTLIMGEQLSTYKTDNAGNEDTTWKFMNYRDTGSAIREYRFKNFKKDFAQSRMNDDTEKSVRNAFLRYYKTLSSDEYRLLRNSKEAYKFYDANLKVSLNFEDGTVTIICLDPYVTQLREANGFFKVTFKLETGEAV